MAAPYVGAFPKLNFLPKAFPIEGAVRLELENGIPVLNSVYPLSLTGRARLV
jgi:hypothetical protein